MGIRDCAFIDSCYAKPCNLDLNKPDLKALDSLSELLMNSASNDQKEKIMQKEFYS